MYRFHLILLCVSLVAGSAHAADPCQTLLCMAGKLQGQSGGGNCDAPISDYFSIVEFEKRGRFDAGKTATARLNFLHRCPAPSASDWPSQINAAYGTLRNLGW